MLGFVVLVPGGGGLLLIQEDYSLQPAKLHVCKHADWHRDLYCEGCLAELNRSGRHPSYTAQPFSTHHIYW